MEHRLIETAVNNIFGDRSKSEFAEAMKNVKDFDITKVETYYNNLVGDICKVVSIREGIDISCDDVEFSIGSEGMRVTTLEDGNLYPCVDFVVVMKRKGLPRLYRMNITPFTAWLDEMGSIGKNYCKQEKITTRMLTKAIKDFHTQIFGEKFEEKFKGYHQFVKSKKVKEIEDKAKFELNEVESMYDTLI